MQNDYFSGLILIKCGKDFFELKSNRMKPKYL